MVSKFNLFWTEEAIRNLESILDYLSQKWSIKEILNFFLADQVDRTIPDDLSSFKT